MHASGGALEATGLTKRFGAVTVLHNIDLRVAPGEVVALVGENGAGKSVLVSCLAGILEPQRGQICLAGQPLPRSANGVREAGVEVVWQDHGLCEELDLVANVHLGREPSWLLAENRMREEAVAVLRWVGAGSLPMDRPVRMLSRGQRQLVALARALLADPQVLLLDEPTASLGVAETLRIQALIRKCRSDGVGILLVSHDLEEVFTLADRVVVLREGRVTADATPQSINRDDVVALMSGIGTDSTARRQLHRLRSLVDQLHDLEPEASLSLIVSTMAAALDQEMICVHLLDQPEANGKESAQLRRSAAVGVPDELLAVNDNLPVGPDGAGAGLAAAAANTVVIDDLASYPAPPPYREAAAAAGIRSEWAAPIVGDRGVLGTVSGFSTSVERPDPAQLELARLYLGYAAAAIERERLLALRRSQSLQRELLASLSHELRTPLTAIQGYASTLRQPDLTWDAASTERFLTSIATEAARLGRLVRDLLDSSAIESGVLSLRRDWCDLHLVVAAALDMTTARPAVNLHRDEQLDPVWGDHDRLEQVFVNLFENAATHGASPHGVDITLRRGARVGTVEVEVRDHGPGIPPELGERIFDPRIRSSSSTSGAGLGLPIARAIVEAHDGTLEVAPADDGASFVVTLPVEPPGASSGEVDRDELAGAWSFQEQKVR